jgi:hypothetical protein
MVKRILATAWLLAGLAFATGASASKLYPGAIQKALNMTCAPPCTICHTDLNGKFDTVTRDFGRAMMATVMLEAGDVDGIPTYLEAFRTSVCVPSASSPPNMDGKPCDSDGDGTNDIEQLEQGRDPNTGLDLCDIAPRYGCGARVASSDADVDGTSLLLAGATALVLARGLRRSKQR